MITSEILKLVSWEIFDPWLPFAVSTLFTVLVSCYTFRLPFQPLKENKRKHCINNSPYIFFWGHGPTFKLSISATRYMMGRSTTIGGVSSEVLSQREALLVRPPCPYQAMQTSKLRYQITRHIIALTTQPPRLSLWWLEVPAGLVFLVAWLDPWRLRSVTKTSSS